MVSGAGAERGSRRTIWPPACSSAATCPSFTTASEWPEPKSPRQTQVGPGARLVEEILGKCGDVLCDHAGAEPLDQLGACLALGGATRDRAERGDERVDVRLEPAVAAVERCMPLRCLGDRNERAVDEERVLVVHEREVAAEPCADRRQVHRHRLHVRATPALAAARHHVRVRGGIEARQLGDRQHVGEHDHRSRAATFEELGDTLGGSPPRPSRGATGI